MNIHENTALLDAFLDGELNVEEMAAVQAHLNTCPDCRAYVDDALAIRAAFPTEETTELPADLKEHVMAAVAKNPQSRPKKQPWGKLAAAAACLALIVAVQHGGFGAVGTDSSANATAAYTADVAVDSTPMERSVEAPESATESDTFSGSSAAYTMDSAPTAAQAENGASEKEENIAVENALTNIPTVRVSAADIDDLLADLTPTETAPGCTRYLLTRAEFDALAAQLAERNISIEAADPTADQLWLEVPAE